MIADTTFLSDFLKEQRRKQDGPATAFFNAKRKLPFRTTIVSAAEIAVLFKTTEAAFAWLALWKIYPLTTGIAAAAADIDRSLKQSRLGENDNWIAGFAVYYREPVISHDEAFDRVPGLRRVVYDRAAK
jgi:predicted nucleic acid-binding protein